VNGITDTHAHVYWKSFDDDREAVFERARAAGVERIVLVGTDPATSLQAFEIAAGRAGVYPTAGIHPHDASGSTASARGAIAELCGRPECVAVGETGLDFFKEFSPREAQETNLRWHLELAGKLDKPVILHCRDAHERLVAILREHAGPRGVRGVMHCYSMGPDELPAYLELGLYISFSGMVTYPKNDRNRAAARAVPPDRLLVETDCPFLAPQSARGQRNEPALVVEVLEELARVRSEPRARLAESTSTNASRLFSLLENR
jgi:TatD DNase family protein